MQMSVCNTKWFFIIETGGIIVNVQILKREERFRSTITNVSENYRHKVVAT